MSKYETEQINYNVIAVHLLHVNFWGEWESIE